MSLNIALLNAVSALQVNSRALDLAAQNVSNVNTEGYSRKIVAQQALVVGGQGAGVTIASITRNVDEFMLADMRRTISLAENSTTQNGFYDRMQDLFGSLNSDSSIGMMVADLGGTLQALAVSPEDISAQTQVVDAARRIAQQFNDIASSIQTLRLQADRGISQSVDEINAQLTKMQDLNIQIARNLALGLEVSELQDQRDVAINKIAENIDVSYFTRSNGEVVLFTKSGQTLLDRTPNYLTHSAATSLDPAANWANGSISGIMLNGTDITSDIGSGRIAAYVEMRDAELPDFQSHYEELAQTLHDELNALHNTGTSYPGLAQINGTRTFAPTDVPVWTGNLRVAVVGTTGVVTETQDFDLSTYATVDDLVTAIDGMANLTASINGAGRITITPAGSNRLTLNELDSAVTVGNQTLGASDFLGLNDLFTSSTDYDRYQSAQTPNATTALGLTGTLTFSGSWGNTAVNYAAGDTMTTVAAAINANPALVAESITATVITDGSGSRLQINDPGDNFFFTDSSNLVATLNLKHRSAQTSSSLAVRSDILADPSRVSRGTLSSAPGLAAADIGVTSGDQSVVQLMANKFSETLSFDATGQLASSFRTMSDYGGAIIGLNSAQATNTANTMESNQFLLANLKSTTASVSGVNVDEEMANLIILENAYNAAARVITTTQKLFDALSEIVR